MSTESVRIVIDGVLRTFKMTPEQKERVLQGKWFHSISVQLISCNACKQIYDRQTVSSIKE